MTLNRAAFPLVLATAGLVAACDIAPHEPVLDGNRPRLAAEPERTAAPELRMPADPSLIPAGEAPGAAVPSSQGV
jgi:hypothetical protein